MELVPCEWAAGGPVILVWTNYPGMELVPYEWAAGGPVILVWNWCPMNGQLVGQLSWYGTSAGSPAVLVWN
jgi:hypothetical protein